MNPGDMEAFQEIVDRSKRIVFFGGAGVSTASGIPDFRSADGLSIITGSISCIRTRNPTRRTGNCSSWNRLTGCGAS